MSDNTDNSRKPTSIVAIGVGNRMRTYMHYVQDHPDRARLVAIVEPDDIRRKAMADKFAIPLERQYSDYKEYFKNPVPADVAFICTPENKHYEPAILALEQGMHILLEKPVAQTYDECLHIDRLAREKNRIVCVCHVLRYHPCFQKIKEIVDSGRFGKIISITHTEDVGIDRQTHSYVRGSMNTERGNNPMILAKCCHDIDFLVWISGAKCHRLASFGSLNMFRKENAPEGAAARCVDCSIEHDCPYSAVDLYWRRRQWINNFDVPVGKTIDDVISDHLHNGPFGRCVFRCDNDVVDNQVMIMQMEDNSLITLCMDIFTHRDGRSTDIKMSRGEIVSDGKKIRVTDFIARKSDVLDYTAEATQPFHAGADLSIVENFINAVRGDRPVGQLTTIAESLESHLLCFEAERSRHSGCAVTPGND